MSGKIKSIEGLRDYVLETFQKLSDGKIDISEASTIAKLSETVISGIKTQLEYARLTESMPHIPFLGNTIPGSAREIKQPKLLK